MKKLTSIFLVSILTASAVLSGCSSSDNTTSSVKTDTSSHGSSSTDNSAASDENAVPDSGYVFWINKQTSWETKDVKDQKLNLFCGQVSLPIDLQAIDDTCAPYFCRRATDKEDPYYETIGEILSSDVELTQAKSAGTSNKTASFPLKIGISTNESKEEQGSSNIGEIIIVNLSKEDEKLPISECYKNGWWYINCGTSDGSNVSTSRYLDISADNINDALDQVIEKNGKPTYIYYRIGGNESVKKNTDLVSYQLIWEYPEYCLCIEVNETISTEDDVYVIKLSNVLYYPTTYWNVLKAEIGEENLLNP